MSTNENTLPVVLQCAGMGDCLDAITILPKICLQHRDGTGLMRFAHRPDRFRRPYEDCARHIDDQAAHARHPRVLTLCEFGQMPYHRLNPDKCTIVDARRPARRRDSQRLVSGKSGVIH